MHGIIFSELRKYAETKHGKETWNTLLRNAGLASKTYLPVQEYPDAEIVAIIGAASSITGLSVSAVLEDFGEFIAPALIKMFGHLLWAEWKTIDVVENTEGTVHSVVRVKNPGAQPALARAWGSTSTRGLLSTKLLVCTGARLSVRLCSVNSYKRTAAESGPEK
jgi:hypothetical protein